MTTTILFFSLGCLTLAFLASWRSSFLPSRERQRQILHPDPRRAVADGRVVDVAPGGHVRQQQVVAAHRHQDLGVRRVEAHARSDRRQQLDTHLGVVAGVALADVVQQAGDAGVFGLALPYQLYLMPPYEMAIAALVLVARRASYPQALLKAYRAGER